jgi:general secretion pathway protein E
MSKDAPEDADAPGLVRELFLAAQSVGASDVHLQVASGELKILFRLDGLLSPVATHPMTVGERIIGRLKYLGSLKTWQDGEPQDGRIGSADAGIAHDVRIATYPTVTGEKIVLRLFQCAEPPTLTELGHSTGITDSLRNFLMQPSGLLLLTGPAGSGKTTTIYACLRELAAGERHVITIEDPVEQVLPGIMQTEVNEARGLSYPKAARHLLRQDPQVLVLGEIRDEETAGIALRTALTGHLVVSTLHAGSCQGVFERLFAMGLDAYSISGAVSLVVNQRLLRKLCAKCRGEGCEGCLTTGYRGRIPIGEHVFMDADSRRKLRESGPIDIAPVGETLRDLGDRLVRYGVTTDVELRRVLG